MSNSKVVGLLFFLGIVCYVPPAAGFLDPFQIISGGLQIVTKPLKVAVKITEDVVSTLVDIAENVAGTTAYLLGRILGRTGAQLATKFTTAIGVFKSKINDAGNGFEELMDRTNDLEGVISDLLNEMTNLANSTFGNTATKINMADTFMKSLQAAISNMNATIAAQQNQTSSVIPGMDKFTDLLGGLQDALKLATNLLAIIVKGIAEALESLLTDALSNLRTNMGNVTTNNWKQLFSTAYSTFTSGGEIYLNASSVRFWLYPTADDQSNAVEIVLNDTLRLSSSGYISGNPLILIIPGVTTNNFDAASILRNVYWDPEKVNLIVVDWKNVAGKAITPDSLPNYIAAYTQLAYSVDFTAQIVNQLLQFIYRTKDYTYRYLPTFTENSKTYADVHFVCHSLGAHVCGGASDYFQKNITGIQINRITAADPAGPYFQDYAASNIKIVDPYNSKRFNKAQARYTQALITNAGGFGFTTSQSISSADIYINGGSWQASCGNASTATLKLTDLEAQCSHNQAVRAMALSTTTPLPASCVSPGTCTPNSTLVGDRIAPGGVYTATITLTAP